MATTVRKRVTEQTPTDIPGPDLLAGAAITNKSKTNPFPHPSGKEKHGPLMQVLRVVSFAIYFIAGCVAYVPMPLRFANTAC